MKDKIFADGIMFKRPRNGAPDFVKGSISIKVADFIPFVEKHSVDGWLNLDLKESKGGKLYLELNTWQKVAQSPTNPQNLPPEAIKTITEARNAEMARQEAVDRQWNEKKEDNIPF